MLGNTLQLISMNINEFIINGYWQPLPEKKKKRN